MNNKKFKKRNPFLVLIWGLGLLLLMQTVLGLAIVVVSPITGENLASLVKLNFTNHYFIFGIGLFTLIVGIPATLLIVKYLWRRNKEWMCFKFNLKLLSCGIMLGFLLPIVIIAILSIFGTVAIIGYPSRFSLIEIGAIVVGYFFLMLFVGLTEELVFRGMLAREWATKWGWVVASIISGTCFGIVHILNLQNVSLVYAVTIASFGLIFGFLFVAMLIRSKSLLLPIGFHTGWNYCLSAFLGTNVSSLKSNLGIFQMELTGPIYLTGGKFGLELSMVTLIVIAITTILFLRYSKSGKINLLSPNSDKPKPKTEK